MRPCRLCGDRYIEFNGICQKCAKETEIDRAMEWVIEYLRWCEVEADKEDFPMESNDYARLADDNIDTCIRYLKKVEESICIGEL